MNFDRFTVSNLIRGLKSWLPSTALGYCRGELHSELVCEIVCVYLNKSLATLNARLFVVRKCLRAVTQCYYQYHDGVSALKYVHTHNCGHCKNIYKGLYVCSLDRDSLRPLIHPKKCFLNLKLRMQNVTKKTSILSIYGILVTLFLMTKFKRSV